jgi:hypothetical protein
MNILVFDTETTALGKVFTYNVGYCIVNTKTGENLVEKDFVIEQIWHNLELFSTAYYAEKRPLYVKAMRSKKAKLEKFGKVCQEMIRDIKKYDVTSAYAYNARFDERVFTFNCDWFKCINPFDNIPIYDIWGYIHHSIAWDNDYQNFCEENELFTEKGNYSTSAENIYKYIKNDVNFVEEHTALSDSLIESEILKYAIENYGMKWDCTYKTYNSIPRMIERTLTIKQDGEEYEYIYHKMIKRDDTIYLK